MSDYRESIRDAFARAETGKVVDDPDRGDSERVARQLRESIVWPEKRFEVKRQRAINEVKEEASDGTG